MCPWHYCLWSLALWGCSGNPLLMVPKVSGAGSSRESRTGTLWSRRAHQSLHTADALSGYLLMESLLCLTYFLSYICHNDTKRTSKIKPEKTVWTIIRSDFKNELLQFLKIEPDGYSKWKIFLPNATDRVCEKGFLQFHGIYAHSICPFLKAAYLAV